MLWACQININHKKCVLWQARSMSASAPARLQIASAPALWHALSLSNDKFILSNSSGLGFQSIWQALSMSNLQFYGLTSSGACQISNSMVWQAQELVKSPILWFDKLRACQISNSMVWQAQELVKSPILRFDKLRTCQIFNSMVWQAQSLSNLHCCGLTSSEPRWPLFLTTVKQGG